MTVAYETAELTGFVEVRERQRVWARTPISRRLELIRKLRHAIAARCVDFAAAIDRDPAETLVSEVLPLADACRFLECRAEAILQPKRLKGDGRPRWLSGTEIEIRREPFGIVLVIGPGNYPLFLPGVQVIQALTAGNAVLVKPGRGGLRSMELLAGCVRVAGFPTGLFRFTGEDPDHAKRAIAAGVDKVILTGSNATGMSVMSQLASFGTPAVMELSGFDPVFVREGADPELVVKAVRFGLELNSGQTCIAPKIVYACPSLAPELQTRFQAEGLGLHVISAGDEQALRLAALSGYALGASVFGAADGAEIFARSVNAGVVVINDMIVPTADPRVPFGGRNRSGFGVTRGAEGLLELTCVKAIITRRSRWLPHLEDRHPGDSGLFSSWIQMSHGGSLAGRARALGSLIKGAMQRRQAR